VRNVFVADERYVTASGGSATADLMLHLIEREHGYDLSVAVADQMVYNAVRDATARSASRSSRGRACATRTSPPRSTRCASISTTRLTFAHRADLGISTRQLERLFGKYLNTSPKKYFMEMRLERARHLLLQTEMSVIEVAVACGFESPGHFARVYRTAYGVTPMMQRGPELKGRLQLVAAVGGYPDQTSKSKPVNAGIGFGRLVEPPAAQLITICEAQGHGSVLLALFVQGEQISRREPRGGRGATKV
jgi:AraC-like DNA-binding protein